jgi:hypothetical protein
VSGVALAKGSLAALARTDNDVEVDVERDLDMVVVNHLVPAVSTVVAVLVHSDTIPARSGAFV